MTKNFIHDCDPGTDCGDAGALAVNNVLMAAGDLNMLAAITSRTNTYSPGAIDAINTYYGHPDIPVGANKGTSFLASDIFAQNLVTNFPNTIPTAASAEEAINLYRATLAAQENKIKINIVGPLRLFYELLISEADDNSPLSGMDLVSAKVSEVVIGAGNWSPQLSTEYNIYEDAAAASYVFANCPVPIAIMDIVIGSTVPSGGTLTAQTPIGNPNRRAYELMVGANGSRPAWDSFGAIYIAYGLDGYFRARRGTGSVDAATSLTHWVDDATGNHLLLSKVKSDAEYTALFDALMVTAP